MSHDIELAYVGIEVPEPSSLASFFGTVIGLLPGEPTVDGAMTWRNDDKAHRLIVRPGPANDAVFVGFEAVDDAAFDKVRSGLDSAGYTVAKGTDAEVKDRRVRNLVRTTSPWGVDVELVVGLEEAPMLFSSALMPSGFLTTDVGFGHAVFATTALDEAHRFLVEGLRFSQSDFLEMELAPGLELEVRFYHCNARHHTIALAKAPFELPQQLHHVMFEANDRDDVGAAWDRVWATDLDIANSLGRHDNDGMFSFYVTSPAGFHVEVGHGGRVVTEPWQGDRRYDRISKWGHQPVKRP
ncbi:MAG: VOC family protein [Acidimicrobiia bacterium]|nr:VOC family protein [Acidimicrobiia bacterium]